MNKNSVLIGILAIANIGLSSCNNELDKLDNNERKTAIDSPNAQYVANLFLHDDKNYEDRKREFDLAE